MSSLVYLLRTPIQTVSHSLSPPDDPNVVVLRVQDTVTMGVPFEPAEILRPGNLFPLKQGERLTYKQLLDVISAAGKVITL